ncbi:MAG: VTC domain-containing protein [Anaerolineales bacterium]|nr:VTC domain-containing protein [Anaerolineales bacterium]
MTEGNSRAYRYERKFMVDQIDHHQAIALIKRHPYLFYQPYPPRFINNFYLDTPEMDNYEDNVCGASDRRKVRLRWYGSLFGNIEKPTLEFKIKRGLVGTKRLYPLGGFTLREGYHAKELRQFAGHPNLPAEVRLVLLTQQIVLLNRYYRYYFATHDNRFRLTVDTGLSYYRIAHFGNRFIHSQTDCRNIIVELKYDNGQEIEANYVSGFFPFRVTKSSKYVIGIERVYF